MRKTLVNLVALCAALLATSAPQIQAETILATGADDPARVIVKLKADSPLLRVQALSAAAP
jgi:hypothetical protein